MSTQVIGIGRTVAFGDHVYQIVIALIVGCFFGFVLGAGLSRVTEEPADMFHGATLVMVHDDTAARAISAHAWSDLEEELEAASPSVAFDSWPARHDGERSR